MLCKKCGQKIEDSTLVCENCGEAVKKSPKKSKKLLFGIIAAVAVIVAVVAVVLNFSLISGAFIKTFGSDDDYFEYVETKAFGAYSDIASQYYANVIDNASGGTAAESEVKISLGDELIDYAESSLEFSLGQKIDLNFLKNLVFGVETNFNGELAYTDFVFKIGDTSVLNADVFIDVENSEGFVALKSLSKKYLKLPLTDIEQGSNLTMFRNYLTDTEFVALLPDEKELNKMLDRYVGVMLDSIDSAAKSSETLKIGEAEQKVTALEVKLSEKDMAVITEALLKEAKGDQELKGYVENVAAYLETEGVIDSADSIYNDFIENIDETIEEIVDAELSEEENIVITEYVNSLHQIVGRKIVNEDELVLSAAIIFEGNTFTAEILGSDEVVISGTGKVEKNSVNGEFTLSVGSEKMCDFIVEGIEFADEKLVGKIKVEPTAKLLDEMGLHAKDGAPISFTNSVFEINFESGEKQGNFSVKIVKDEELIIGLEVLAEVKEVAEITLPKGSNIVSDSEEWAESFEFSKLINSLKDAGVSDILTQVLEYVLMPTYIY